MSTFILSAVISLIGRKKENERKEGGRKEGRRKGAQGSDKHTHFNYKTAALTASFSQQQGARKGQQRQRVSVCQLKLNIIIMIFPHRLRRSQLGEVGDGGNYNYYEVSFAALVSLSSSLPVTIIEFTSLESSSPSSSEETCILFYAIFPSIISVGSKIRFPCV